MYFYKISRPSIVYFLTNFVFCTCLLLVLLTTSCTALTPQQSDEQALKVLREMTSDGKFPPESVVLQIENTFSRSRTGALAKLLRAWIHFENKDFEGAAAILDSDVFRSKTNVADYALWLRGKSLEQASRHTEAMSIFAELSKNFPNSLRIRQANLLWAGSALQSGQTAQVPNFLNGLIDKNDADALLLTAKSFEQQGNQTEAINFYRKVYFYGAGTEASKEAETKLTSLGHALTPQTIEEARVRADKLFNAKNYAAASNAYTELLNNFPGANLPSINLKRIIAFANLRKTSEAQMAFNLIPPAANEKEQGFYELTMAFAKAKQWSQTRQIVEEMRARFPKSQWTPKTLVGAGMAARDAKNKVDEAYFLRTAVSAYPSAVEVAGAQFELAWMEHENNNFTVSSQMLTEHLARYADKDTTSRGKAGYWAARDSEKAGKIAEACALYDAVIYRYGANWYGYIGLQRLKALRASNRCQSPPQFSTDSFVSKAAENLKIITVAPETATDKELEKTVKAEELGAVGLFEWAFDELKEAQKTAPNSPKVNLALARHYRFRRDNVNALLALAKSYPDYSQMFPDEMGREEWDIFYPLTNWNEIKLWARNRQLDPFQVAGLIRQESVFNARAKSHADAYGLMQLLIPTARATAKKYGTSASITSETLFQPALNIELGTAYMRDQLSKYGRLEYMAVAYNAGPGRVPQWQASLPFEIDEFVEAIPFKETKGYVQGVIRNSAQYRRLYDENGKFKTNVGTRPLRGEIDSKTREQFAQEFPEVVLDDKQDAK
ncbi:MAG: transglycosylase SLT domain-containing protein [Acidobacteria bacterium]|nr:transglycosylase SLT domain-containing protein [Acidobacteriota bacterium]